MSNGFVRTVLAEQGLGAEVGLDAGPGPTLYLADAELAGCSSSTARGAWRR
ncbi:MAG: hypothetical protein R2724_18065 [Bryobacterales bacterium]